MDDDLLDPPPLVPPPVAGVASPRRLTVVPRRKGKQRGGTDVTLPVPTELAPGRQWWRQPLGKILESVGSGRAMEDVCLLAYMHIARRLTNASTPDKVKDDLAKAIGVKVSLQLIRRVPGAEEDPPGSGGPSDGRGILHAYRSGPGSSPT